MATSSKGVLSLFIINRNGGLVYMRDFDARAPALSGNERLRFAGFFHSMYAIASGFRTITTDSYTLHCLQVPTGSKVVVTALNNAGGIDTLCQRVYEHYTDHVLKNPFYELDQPIGTSCEGFDNAVSALLS